MSDRLRNKLIRLAHSQPELRPKLLPLLTKKAAVVQGPKLMKKALHTYMDEVFDTIVDTHGEKAQRDWRKVEGMFAKKVGALAGARRPDTMLTWQKVFEAAAEETLSEYTPQ